MSTAPHDIESIVVLLYSASQYGHNDSDSDSDTDDDSCHYHYQYRSAAVARLMP